MTNPNPEGLPSRKIHILKIWPEHFKNVVNGTKTAEIRFDDRKYQVGDTVVLKEWFSGEFTGKQENRVISHILRDFEPLAHGYVMLSFSTAMNTHTDALGAALEFYAKDEHYLPDERTCTCDVIEDGGYQARAALEAWKVGR